MKPRIVLFDANVGNAGAPLALLAITSLIDAAEYDIQIITKAAYPDYRNVVVERCKGALCFGVSAILGMTIQPGLDMSAAVKAAYPSLPIIWGGWAVTTLPRIALAEPYIDYVCIGQGERTFGDFISMLAGKKDVTAIPGLGYKRNSEIILNEPRNLEDLNAFPAFDLNLIDWEKHIETGEAGARTISFYTSVGCPWRCGFCCEQYSSRRRWYGLSADKVVDILLRLRSVTSFDSVKVVDANYFVSEKRVRDIANLMIAKQLHLTFEAVDGRTNDLLRYSTETWEAMRNAGIYSILIGAESGENCTLEYINKGATVEQTLGLVRRCRDYGIKIFLSCAVGWNARRYVEHDINQVFSEEVNALTDLCNQCMEILPDRVNMLLFFYGPQPGTSLYDEAIECGFRPYKSFREWGQYDLTNVIPPWMQGLSKSNIRRFKMLQYIMNLLGYNYPNIASRLPAVAKIPAMCLIAAARKVARVRLKHKWLSIGLDRIAMRFIEDLFRRVNRHVKMLHLHDMINK